MNQQMSHRIEAVRRFNRFYTRQIGLLQEGLAKSTFSLPQARIIYELAQHNNITATQLCEELGFDPGYLSRLLKELKNREIIHKKPSDTDGRKHLITLSEKGQAEYSKLKVSTQQETQSMISRLPEEHQRKLLEAMHTIESLLDTNPSKKTSYLLRPHQPGDIGWVIQAHGRLYNQEYNWDESFEGLAAEIAGQFLKNYDHRRERCWIAEIDGVIVGSVFLMQKSDSVAQLRMLLIEPKARGLGIGKRLVQECTRFATQVGYEKIMLWTNSVLHTARHLYQREGYQLITEKPHHSFGHDLVGETWELAL